MIKDKKKILLLIVIVGFLARITYMTLFSDFKSERYWEFGYIAENLHAGNGYSLFYFENDTLKQDFKPDIKPLASAFMPPAYVYYLFPFFYISDTELRNILIFMSQILLSLLLIIIIYYFTKEYFSERTAIISAVVVSILPEFILTSVTFNGVVHYHILLILILYLLLKIDLFSRTRIIILFSIISGLMLYLRSEYILFLSFVLIYFLFRKKFKYFAVSVSVIIILLSPWIIRNATIFNEFVPFTTSGGLNFYRGHNQYYIGNWGTLEYSREIMAKSKGNDFEILYNRFYFDKGKDYIINNKSEEIKDALLKIFHLWIMNPGDKRVFNPAYLIPSLLITLLAFIGIIIKFSLEKYKFIYLFLFSSTLVSIVFLALPRYQTMMKIILIPFFAYTVECIYFKITKGNIEAQ